MSWELGRGAEPSGPGWEPFGFDGGEVLWRRCRAGPPGALPRFVSIGDVAAMLSVAASTVRRWVAAGELPKPVKIGGTLRWQIDSIVESVARRSVDR